VACCGEIHSYLEGKRMVRKKRIYDQEFNIVEEGLDEGQVVGFIAKLMQEHKELVQQFQSIESLGRLAQATVVEAEKLAMTIKEEAKRQAETETARIIHESEKKAGAIVADAARMERLAAEEATAILCRAKEEAEAMKAEARRESESFVTQAKHRIEAEAENAIAEIYGKLMDSFESSITHFRNLKSFPVVKATCVEQAVSMAEAQQTKDKKIELEAGTYQSRVESSIAKVNANEYEWVHQID